MSKSLPVYFESSGSISHVLHDASTRLPLIFPESSHEYIRSINGMVAQHAEQNQWDAIVLIVSKGISRQVLENLTQQDLPHKGKIIIDPTASTMEHNLFDSDTLLKSSKERLIMMNEDCDDALIILYGLDKLDRATGLAIAKRNLGAIDMLLNMMLDEEDMTMEDIENLQQARLRERLKKAKEQIRQLTLAISLGEGKEEDEASIAYRVGSGVSLLFFTIASLHVAPNNFVLQHYLTCILDQVKSIPASFLNIGFDLTPFLDPDIMVLNSRTPPIMKQALQNERNPPPPRLHRDTTGMVLDPE